MSIGARSQSARTYLEKSIDEFGDCDLESLVAHGLRALRDTLPNEVDLTNKVRVFKAFHLAACFCIKEILLLTFIPVHYPNILFL